MTNDSATLIATVEIAFEIRVSSFVAEVVKPHRPRIPANVNVL